MAVEVKDVEISLRDMEKYILREAAGCRMDDEKAQVFTYSYQSCVLVLQALAKKILGIDGLGIGNNPTRAQALGYSDAPRDFTEERKQALVSLQRGEISEGVYQSKLELIQREEAFANRVAAEQDPQAWAKVLELTEILSRRAMALARIGLLDYNVDSLVATEFELQDREAGGSGKSPMEGSVTITDKGRGVVGSQRWPVPRKKQRMGVSRIDEDLELPK